MVLSNKIMYHQKNQIMLVDVTLQQKRAQGAKEMQVAVVDIAGSINNLNHRHIFFFQFNYF